MTDHELALHEASAASFRGVYLTETRLAVVEALATFEFCEIRSDWGAVPLLLDMVRSITLQRPQASEKSVPTARAVGDVLRFLEKKGFVEREVSDGTTNRIALNANAITLTRIRGHLELSLRIQEKLRQRLMTLGEGRLDRDYLAGPALEGLEGAALTDAIAELTKVVGRDTNTRRNSSRDAARAFAAAASRPMLEAVVTWSLTRMDEIEIDSVLREAAHEASVASSGQAEPEDTVTSEDLDDETFFAQILEGDQSRNATRLALMILADDGSGRVVDRFLDKAPPSVTRQLAELALWGQEDVERLAHLLELSFDDGWSRVG